MSEVDPHTQAMERRRELIKRHIFERYMHETNPVISRPIEEINRDLKQAFGLPDELG